MDKWTHVFWRSFGKLVPASRLDSQFHVRSLYHPWTSSVIRIRLGVRQKVGGVSCVKLNDQPREIGLIRVHLQGETKRVLHLRCEKSISWCKTRSSASSTPCPANIRAIRRAVLGTAVGNVVRISRKLTTVGNGSTP